MPGTSTPASVNVENFDEDVGLGVNDSTPPNIIANYSATENIPGVLIYAHGWSVRVCLDVGQPDALAALARCGWSPNPPARVWRRSSPGPGITRYTLRGSVWLTGRIPKNTKLPFADLNKKWKTRLYSLSVEIRAHDVHVDLAGVRHDDIHKFMQDMLGLGKADYTVMYYRTLERFIVLTPAEAHKLAEGLGAVPKNGAGRDSGKRYLVKDFEIPVPVVIRKRKRVKAHLVVYRVRKGATAAYKVEVRLRGQRHDRGEFHESDIVKMDHVLLDLVDQYDLKTIPKPARWEPRTFVTAVERSTFDACVKAIPEKAWRGPPVAAAFKRTVMQYSHADTVNFLASTREDGEGLDCHTLEAPKPGVGAGEDGSFPPAARIRSAIPTPHCSSTAVHTTESGKSMWTCIEQRGMEVSRYVQDRDQKVTGQNFNQRDETNQKTVSQQKKNPYNLLVQDIFQSRLPLHEIILHPEQSPRDLLHALTVGVLGRIGVGAICAGHDTYQSVIEASRKYPYDADDVETHVLYVDTSAVAAVASAVVGNQEPTVTDDGEIIGDFDSIMEPGPLWPEAPWADALPSLFWATGAWLDDLLRELRRIGEETGKRHVIITCDGRTDGGDGPMKKSHYYTDKRVRSTIGDAGRQHAHMRYLVERVRRTRWVPGYKYEVHEGDETIVHEHVARVEHEHVVGNIVAIKDEAEGLPGRIIYEAPVQPERPRWNQKKKPL